MPENNPAPVTRVGNITRDPEIKFGQEKGTPYCRFGIATDTPIKPGDWSGPKKTVFYEVTCYGRLASNAADCLRKGDRVLVTGRPETVEYEKKDGSGMDTSRRIHAAHLGAELTFATAAITRNPKEEQTGDVAPASVGQDEEPF
jgi:single-strand DNA-binding protein